MASCNCDTHNFRVVLVRAVLIHHSCVANIISLIKGNIVEADDLKGTCSFNYMILRAHGSFNNSLAQSTYFILI